MTGMDNTGEYPIDWGLIGADAEQCISIETIRAEAPEALEGSEKLLQQLIDGYMRQGYSGEEAERLGSAFLCGALAGAVAVESKVITDFVG